MHLDLVTTTTAANTPIIATTPKSTDSAISMLSHGHLGTGPKTGEKKSLKVNFAIFSDKVRGLGQLFLA